MDGSGARLCLADVAGRRRSRRQQASQGGELTAKNTSIAIVGAVRQPCPQPLSGLVLGLVADAGRVLRLWHRRRRVTTRRCQELGRGPAGRV